MKFKPLLVLAIFVLSSVWAFRVVEKSWGGRVYIGQVMKNRRFPAAIHKRSDFTHLSGPALRMASQEQLLRDAEVISRHDSVGIRLGLFFRLNENRDAVSACDDYSQIRMEFVAENIAENGVPPSMTIEAPCLVGEDFERLAPIWIPVDKLSGKPMHFVKFPELGDVSFTFSSPSENLPKNWRLGSIVLINPDQPGQMLEINSENMRAMKLAPLQLHF